jgi:hypothetical protein
MHERLGLSLFRINCPPPLELVPDLAIDNSGLSSSFTQRLNCRMLRICLLPACYQKQIGCPEGHFGLLARNIERARDVADFLP